MSKKFIKNEKIYISYSTIKHQESYIDDNKKYDYVNSKKKVHYVHEFS